jgi:hypothetical protein
MVIEDWSFNEDADGAENLLEGISGSLVSIISLCL